MLLKEHGHQPGKQKDGGDDPNQEWDDNGKIQRADPCGQRFIEAEEDENGGGTQTWDDQAQPPQKAAQNKTWKGWGDLCGHAVFEDLKQQICQRQRKDKGRPIFVGAAFSDA